MRGLIAGGTLLAVMAVFFLVIPAIQMQQAESARVNREQAVIVSKIADSLARAGVYKIMVAAFYARHGYFPSHIDELRAPPAEFDPSQQSAARIPDIEIANYGDVVLDINDANDLPIGKVTLTAFDDGHSQLITWECHTTDFENIGVFFPQCRYETEAR